MSLLPADDDGALRRNVEAKYVEQMQLEPSFISLGRYAEFQLTMEDVEKADKYYQEAMKYAPDEDLAKKSPEAASFSNIYAAYGFFLESFQKKLDQAAEMYDTALRIYPLDPIALGNMAMLKQQVGRPVAEVEEYVIRLLFERI